MDLRSGYPFSLMKNGILNSYPALEKNIKTEIAVIGGGVSGALIAYHLVHAGVNVVVLDKRHIGLGSTCASTSLLQYEIDTPLHELIEKAGKRNAEESYLLCLESIFKLGDLSKKLHIDAEYKKKKSLYLASGKKDVNTLEKEYKARRNIGLRINLLDEHELKEKYSLSAPAGLLSHDSAEMDAYRFTHGIFTLLVKKDVPVYDKTKIIEIKNNKRGAELITQNGYVIKAKKIVFATGYESQDYLSKPFARLHSTYVIISEPIPGKKLFNYLLWESSRPYLYMRTTHDNRIIVGGKDEMFYSPGKRDRLIKRKSKQLLQAFQKKFPHIPFKTDFQWAGTFAETKDGLPYIGTHHEHPHAYFALGFGGNGITFSLIAAEIIRDLFIHGKNSSAHIFSFTRKNY